MILCHCNQVTSGQVAHLVDEGATTLEDVAARCSATQDCGGCHAAIDEVVERLLGRATACQAA